MFLYWLGETEGFYEAVDSLIRQASEGGLTIATSDVVYTEVLKVPGVDEADGGQQAIEALLDREWIEILASNTEIMRAAGDVRREYGLAGIDSIHVATAIAYKVPVLYTYDEEMLSKRRILTNSGSVRIEKPQLAQQARLLLESHGGQ